MGSNTSKQYERSDVNSRDILNLTLRLRDALNDPVYKNGVEANSVVQMMEDIKSAYFKETAYIRLPSPVDGTAPFDSISFRSMSAVYPEGLYTPKRTLSTSNASRRVRSYSIANGGRHSFPTTPVKDVEESIDDMIEEIRSERGEVDNLIATLKEAEPSNSTSRPDVIRRRRPVR